MTESSNSTLGFTVSVPVIFSPVPARTEVTVPTLSIPAWLSISSLTAGTVGINELSAESQVSPVAGNTSLPTISLNVISTVPAFSTR